MTKLNGSVPRSPGSVTGGIAKESETNEADHTGSVATNKLANLYAGLQCLPNKSIIYVTRMLLPRLPTHGETNQPHRIGRQDRSPERSSEGKKNKPNHPHRIGRQDRSPESGLAKERKTNQTNHTGSVARIGHQRGLAMARKTKQTKPTTPDRLQDRSPERSS